MCDLEEYTSLKSLMILKVYGAGVDDCSVCDCVMWINKGVCTKLSAGKQFGIFLW